MKSVTFSLVLAILYSFLPSQLVLAGDIYANGVAQVSMINLLQPYNAIGAPDELYADFLKSNISLTLDMGEGEEGIGDLTIRYYLLEYGAIPYVSFYDADMNELDATSFTLPAGQFSYVVPYSGDEPYRYVRFSSYQNKVWRLDAIAAADIYEPEEEAAEEEIPVEESVVEEILPFEPGTLVKSPTSSAVYVYGSDGKRHAFPNEATFYSWEYDFTNVTILTEEELALYPLGANVTMRPGIYLVKMQTSPVVYAVSGNNTLHEIGSEGLAITLYGADWEYRVIDVPDVFWNDYTIGETMETAEDISVLSGQEYPF